MHLRRILLRDWKAYVNARFEFPAPKNTKNVTLIGAINGFGKTSLFEALVLGLFGRHGLPLIARAPFSGAEDTRLSTTYNQFISGALHKRALEEGRSSCSVELFFENSEDGPLILKRTWHFFASGQSAGQHKPGDEELVIFEGPQERPVRVPMSERDNEAEWLRGYVARKLLPHTLAHFFLFDGEQVQALARRDMGVQVRMGIEGLLGIPVLRELAEDLRQYASQRRTGQGAASDQTIRRIEAELTSLDKLKDDAATRLGELNPTLEEFSNRRDQLTQELGSFSGGSVALLREKQEEFLRLKQERERLWEKLSQDLAGGVALALVGKELRERTNKQLSAEGTRENWMVGRAQVERRLEPFLEAVQVALRDLSPSLDVVQQSQVQEKIREAFQTLWHPAPDGCADIIRHSYLSSPERAMVCERLLEVETLTSGDLAELVDVILSTDEKIRALNNEIAGVQGIAPQLEEKVAELNRLNKQIDTLSNEKGRLDRDVEALSGQIAAKRQELARYTKSRSDAAPALRRANRADLVADVIESIVRDGVPGQIDAVAQNMTQAWKAMAHKTIVSKVDIDADCNVRLLTGSGRNMRELDLSAGEQQLFALALISAVAKVSGRDFPVIVDTPLARLDKEHRLGVLRHFTEQPRQVILLSTDTEVVGEYLDAVRGRVANSYLLKHEHDGDIGRSWPVDGYFRGQEI